ncbi:MAG: preprotein translocase subunit SecG [Omnitrophica bacterium RIFCSPLOWO2_02_FULL_45_16]|nr:MAG: preprotein translocase subunit SecG [Omnitrophica bacterium RIFCSPHIGHO2_02_FULL_46_20]OGW94594.1 MAG: preprotein translocase subunit SecG [Omnitrophica bacterium RIFCSPLOWO2_01_FULL_45_24]OGW94669.1 MAG: preprotein translocase subunit SecG [Omnitrophica bacterium RIFCSPLOWO2_12_FULL_45_13]OGX00961.1 MAG: preprotein translocase subunit SecG [Omnitrophica bacterium RIFCSPLOWO2_02_FULL_45_16]
MLYGFVMAIHVIVSLVLISVILLQAGRGGGLSESFGGSQTQTILGTKTSVFLKRATAVSAVLYILVCLVLGVMTSHRGRSLVARGGIQPPITTSGGVPQPAPDTSPIDY